MSKELISELDLRSFTWLSHISRKITEFWELRATKPFALAKQPQCISLAYGLHQLPIQNSWVSETNVFKVFLWSFSDIIISILRNDDETMIFKIFYLVHPKNKSDK